ncbi:hypothetical protein Taci_1656 [Thermanaerovibrio acidaminovorans DSM 6589]|uniref:Uncharacterized protein n=1 Tax=Thermanaerovibrio acidaminovorans (strain ATCC 49978 / DSM 6589 / Su883) TaxID=525903 RepID=D1B779_THEAS|nr:hypothetical protein [Thermanaerovibrio acidaminovorans]ACZ19870.1 hypothetical protein Taci_1656 [Thermanaerovibrio acidaminovorans DSM 6589]
MTIRGKLLLLAAGVTALMVVMVGVVTYNSYQMLNRQVNTAGAEMIQDRALQVDLYFDRLSAVAQAAQRMSQMAEKLKTLIGRFKHDSSTLSLKG